MVTRATPEQDTPKVLRGMRASYGNIVYRNSAGKMGRSYLATPIHEGVEEDWTQKYAQVFIKLPTLPESLGDLYALRESMTDRYRGIFSEYMNFARIKESTSDVLQVVARVLDAGIYEQKMKGGLNIILPFLVQEEVEGKNLFEFREKDLRGQLSLEQWLSLAIPIVNALEKVHFAQFAHGDFHPGNIMVTGGPKEFKVKIVDFGQAIIGNLVFNAPDHELRREHNYFNDSQRRGVQSHYSHLSDIYSLGAVLLFLSCNVHLAPKGNPQQEEFLASLLDGHKANGIELVEGIAELIRSHNRELLTSFPALPSIIDKAMNHELSGRYQSVWELRRDLALFSVKTENKPGLTNESEVTETLTTNVFIKRLISQEREAYELSTSQITAKNPRVDRFGHRDIWFTSLLTLLASLEEGDEYYTITTPAFWSSNNLGWNRRFLAINKTLLLRGVNIHRLFVLNKGRDCSKKSSSDLWNKVRAAHLEVLSEIPYKHKQFANFYERLEDEIKDKELFGPNHVVALWFHKKLNQFTTVNFRVDPASSQILGVSFIDYPPSLGEALKEAWMDNLFAGARRIENQDTS